MTDSKKPEYEQMLKHIQDYFFTNMLLTPHDYTSHNSYQKHLSYSINIGGEKGKRREYFLYIAIQRTNYLNLSYKLEIDLNLYIYRHKIYKGDMKIYNDIIEYSEMDDYISRLDVLQDKLKESMEKPDSEFFINGDI